MPPATPHDNNPWRQPSELAAMVALTALYYLLARWGLEIAGLRYAPVSLVWPASGIALALVLRFGHRLWPLLFAVAVAATWPTVRATGTSAAVDVTSALLIGGAAVLEPVLAVWAIRRVAGGTFLERAPAFLITVLIILPLSAAMATIPLVAGSLVGGLATVNHWAGMLLTWYGMAFSDLIGMVILAPPIWLWLRQPFPRLRWSRALELLGYIAIAGLALSVREPVQPFYLLFAAHLAIAVRLPIPYAAAAVAVTSCVLTWQAANDLAASTPPAVQEVFLTELTLLLTLNLLTYLAAVLTREAVERHEQLEQRVAERTHALEQANSRLQRLSNTDALTGAWNRRYFDDHTRRELERAAHGGSTTALLALDLDHFKRINDEHGHPTGDAVLEQVVARLDHQLRPGDLLARIGGEEFVVFLPSCGRETAREIAQRLCETVAAGPIGIDGQEIPVSVSIGVTVTRPADDRQGRPVDDLLRAAIAAADRNLFEAKRA
ncbi:MAG: diguanylate cyclase, partial [Halofilum sp. (in: g-proteobacteria)]